MTTKRPTKADRIREAVTQIEKITKELAEVKLNYQHASSNLHTKLQAAHTALNKELSK